MHAILFDIGGTKIRMAYSETGDFFDEPAVVDTPKEYEEGKKVFENLAIKLSKGRGIENVVGGMSRSVTNWSYDTFGQDLRSMFQSQIFLENDAAVVGLGEAAYGAGRGFPIVAYITVSTGVGGAKISNGRIDEKAVGFEPGKQIIDIESGRTISLEELISGKAFTAKTGKHPKDVTDPVVWDEHAKYLAYGLNNIIVEWSPNVVVLGGSMITGDPAIPIDKTQKYLEEVLKIFPQIPVIKKAELGDFGGIYGALALLRQL